MVPFVFSDSYGVDEEAHTGPAMDRFNVEFMKGQRNWEGRTLKHTGSITLAHVGLFAVFALPAQPVCAVCRSCSRWETEVWVAELILLLRTVQFSFRLFLLLLT